MQQVLLDFILRQLIGRTVVMPRDAGDCGDVGFLRALGQTAQHHVGLHLLT